ncbi:MULTISPECIES: universal stress protein [unclassified Spirosoma]|uniref:universal stress protein n=1 Tax=unclassified Spirosoma TaxID=2621999 RepID=UPI00095D11A5|nr:MULTISPECIES: universal stress protein [unclassified Spirosoma]MBN8824187.1 universal stress protein [Spirosoma sp.]OJW78924.1 MAG: universal stress protein UspA [Spirosoma sp. 48-14]
MYKILLLTDFSAASQHAIAYTQALFDDTAADFCLLYVCPIEPDMEYAGATLLAERWQMAEKSLKQLRAEITGPSSPAYHTYRTMAVMGSPAGIVNQLLVKEHYDLVVLGATGSGWSELLGSVATDLVRDAKTNVLVIPASAPIRPMKTIVLATDYRSVNDAQSLRLLNDLASRKDADLTVLTIENPEKPETRTSALGRQYILDAFQEVQTDTYTIYDDSVLRGIRTYLKMHTVDMLVMLPHHKSLFDIIRHRSVSRTMAFQPTVPFLALYDAPLRDQPSKFDKIPFATYLD